MLNLSYPACVGRNMDEIVRCMKALQLSYSKAIATPADWPENYAEMTLPDGTKTTEYKGSVFLLPAVTEEEAQEHYPQYRTCEVPSKKNYLRLVKAEDVADVPIQKPKKGETWHDKMLSVYRQKKEKESKKSVTKRLFPWLYKFRGSKSKKSVWV